MSSAAEIVAEANDLARLYYTMHGYEVERGYRFDKANHPQEQQMWEMVALAFELLRGTDLEECVAELDGDE